MDSREICKVEMHTAGEPLRIITSGFPDVKGETVIRKAKLPEGNLDSICQLLMSEPRGHRDMFGALLVHPDNEQADLGVLFMYNGGYSVMCGHGVIALARYAVDSGMVMLCTCSRDRKRSHCRRKTTFIVLSRDNAAHKGFEHRIWNVQKGNSAIQPVHLLLCACASSAITTE